MSARKLPPPRHLFVRLPNPLGDAVMATPALRALREALPATRITWGGGRAVQQALAGLPDRDAVMPMAGALASGWRAPFRAARLLRTLEADAALLLPNSTSSALAVWRARIPTRVGTALPGRRRAMFLTHTVNVPLGEDDRLVPRWMVDHYADVVAPFGAVLSDRVPRVVAQPFDHERALRRLRPHAGRPLLSVNPGAAFGPSKVYPPEHVAAVVRALCETHDLVPLILCGPGEEALAAQVAATIDPPVVSTHDAPPDVGELKALLAQSALLLTTDAGPRHLARALGVPCVVWMGPTDPRWGGTDDEGVTLLRREGLACLACHERVCPIDHPCMQTLAPEAVAAAAAVALGAATEGKRGRASKPA